MVSIIIVHYKVKKELFSWIESIRKSKTKIPYEIIVVDNDEKPTLEKELKKLFPRVKYVSGQGNVGFGQGNNLGSVIAKGELLFFLNPDTTIHPGTVGNLTAFLNKNKQAAIVAPLLHHMDGKPYQQGTLELTPLRAIMSLSFLHRLFSSNPIAKKYYLADWNKQTVKEVDVAPGTAFVIRKNIFEKVGGFDSNFFLFFEEFDLCRKVKKLGGKIYILPTAKVFHHWGASTKKASNINKIFMKSRFYYFKKHFGVIPAFLTEAVLRINKYTILLAILIALGGFFRLIQIGETMTFLGDQGWFYLSARDMLTTGTVPLVGIASSHPWLHQGALWTYLLALWLWLFHFDPLSPTLLTTLLDSLTIVLLYRLGSLLFAKKVGLIAASMYAVSPLVLSYARMPYHTSLIALFTIIFIQLVYKWIKGSKNVFPFIIFILGILYNIELATFLLTALFALIVIYGLLKNKPWAKAIQNRKIILFSFAAFILSMLPMLIYDMSHNFVQTIGFLVWIIYKGLLLVGYPPIHSYAQVSFKEMVTFWVRQNSGLIFPYNLNLALGVFAAAVLFLTSNLYRKTTNLWLLFVMNIFLLGGFFMGKTPSEAYLPIFFPGMFLLFAYFITSLIESKRLKIIGYLLFINIFVANVCYLSTNYYSFRSDAGSFKQRLSIAKEIVNQAEGKEYNLMMAGVGSEFVSSTMNYEYLTWWLGHGPAKSEQQLKFVIEERGVGTKVTKKMVK